jgi:hypothetical protein
MSFQEREELGPRLNQQYNIPVGHPLVQERQV